MADYPTIGIMEAYIRMAAKARGIDPDVAVKVAKTEGLAPGVWQATGNLGYGRERSYGPFQLHVAPEGYDPGLGNDMIKKTGLDPSDPSTWRSGVDFALNKAAKTGWGDWFGARGAGILGKMGIGPGATALPVSSPGTGGADLPISAQSTFPPRPEAVIPKTVFQMSGMDQMPPVARPSPPSMNNAVTPPINPLRVGPKPFNPVGPQPGISAPLAAPTPSGGIGLGSIMSVLGSFLGGMDGGQQQAPPAPPPSISVPRSGDVSQPKFNYFADGRGQTTDDEFKKLMAALGM